MSLTILPKLEGEEKWDFKPNTPGWFQEIAQDGTVSKPYIKCNCGIVTGIRSHGVAKDGNISPSFWHRKGDTYPEDPKGCGWHVWLRLNDYKGEAYPPGTM